jgi:hypothetical protein
MTLGSFAVSYKNRHSNKKTALMIVLLNRWLNQSELSACHAYVPESTFFVCVFYNCP